MLQALIFKFSVKSYHHFLALFDKPNVIYFGYRKIAYENILFNRKVFAAVFHDVFLSKGYTARYQKNQQKRHDCNLFHLIFFTVSDIQPKLCRSALVAESQVRISTLERGLRGVFP